MRKNIFFISIFFFLLTSQIYSITENSLKLKMQGDTAFMQKDYMKAIEYFMKAVKEDNTNYFAYYNISRTLCVLRSEGGSPCDIFYIDGNEFDLQQATIFNYLREGILISPEVIRFMEKDTAIVCLHSSLEYHFHMGKQLNKPVDFQNMLTMVNWRINFVGENEWTTAEGKISFTRDLKFKIELYDLDVVGTGSYSISPYQIKMRFDKPFLDRGQIWAMIKSDRISILGLVEEEIVIWNTTEECNF